MLYWEVGWGEGDADKLLALRVEIWEKDEGWGEWTFIVYIYVYYECKMNWIIKIWRNNLLNQVKEKKKKLEIREDGIRYLYIIYIKKKLVLD